MIKTHNALGREGKFINLIKKKSKNLQLASFLGFPGSSVVKNPLAMQEPQEMWVRSLDWEDALDMEKATHSSILATTVP